MNGLIMSSSVAFSLFRALLIDAPFLLDYQENNCTLLNLLECPLRLAVLNNLSYERDEKYTVINQGYSQVRQLLDIVTVI